MLLFFLSNYFIIAYSDIAYNNKENIHIFFTSKQEIDLLYF